MRRDGVEAADFSLSEGMLFVTALREEGPSLFLGIDNSQAIAPFTKKARKASAFRPGI